MSRITVPKVKVIQFSISSLDGRAVDTMFSEAMAQLDLSTKRSGEPVMVDMSNATFVDPVGITSIWAILHVAQNHYRRVRLELPNHREVLSYLDRMGLFSLLDARGIEYGSPDFEPWDRTTNPAGLLELTTIVDDEQIAELMANIMKRLRRIMSMQLGGADKVIAGFSTALSESCLNVVDHSGSLGVAAAQTYKRKKGRVVTISVADCGCGIRQTLGTKYPRLAGGDHGIAIIAALRKKRSRLPGRGLGLYVIKQLLTEYPGSLHVRSGNATVSVQAEPELTARIRRSCFFPGTQIWISLVESRI
jgi:anti-sigma regulatory factor (Ser/Thr protein kinase)